METVRIMFVTILQLINLFPWFGGGGGGLLYKSDEFDRGQFEIKPLKVSGSYFVGVVQLVVTPKGYISSTTRDCCDICIWFNALKVTRVDLLGRPF